MECNGLLNQLSFRKRAYSIKQFERLFDSSCCCCVCFSAKYLCCCRLFFHFMSQSFFANLLFVQPYLKEKNEVSRIKHFFVYSHTLSSFNNSFATSVPRVQKLKETEKKRPNTISNSIPLFYPHSYTKLHTITINDHTDKSNSEYQSELNANENLYSKRTQIESINCFAVYFQTEHNKETNEKYAQTREKTTDGIKRIAV